MDYVYFVGAPLSRSTDEKLLPYTKVEPWMGTTEAGPYSIRSRDEEDWEYSTLRDSNGMQFEHVDDGNVRTRICAKARIGALPTDLPRVSRTRGAQDGRYLGGVQIETGRLEGCGYNRRPIVFSHGKSVNFAALEMQLK